MNCYFSLLEFVTQSFFFLFFFFGLCVSWNLALLFPLKAAEEYLMFGLPEAKDWPLRFCGPGSSLASDGAQSGFQPSLQLPAHS